jgi:hypothetical protein
VTSLQQVRFIAVGQSWLRLLKGPASWETGSASEVVVEFEFVMRAVALCVAVVACLVTSSASSADFGGNGGGYYSKRHYCRFVENANYLLSLDFRTLRMEVAKRYEQAVDVFNRQSTVYSTSPLFEWSNQTKIACAKSIGYLRRHLIWGPEIDVESTQQCECFYDRMLSYLGGRGASEY